MTRYSLLWRVSVAALIMGAFVWRGAVTARADVDPKAAAYINIKDVKWNESKNGASASYLISGDPNKEGSLYVELMRWHAGHNSRPHKHPHDRFITVLEGTWWVGTGTNYDNMNGTTPMGPGTVVTHYGNEYHYDGAKDGDCTLVIVGIGPAGSTPAPGQKAEKKE
jgi:hypothetical protein